MLRTAFLRDTFNIVILSSIFGACCYEEAQVRDSDFNSVEFSLSFISVRNCFREFCLLEWNCSLQDI